MMDSNLPFLPPSNSDTKNSFRKPSGDAANRNYQHRSPVDRSPSPDASRHGHSSSPNPVRENSARVSHHSRKYDDREHDQQYGRNHYGRSSDSLRHSDRQSFKSSFGHSRYDKYANEDRYRERLLSRSGHESRDDHVREESDSRPKNYQCSVDKYSHDKYDRSDHRSKEKRRDTYSEHQKYKDMDSSYEKSASSKRHALYDEVEREGHSRDWDGQNERRDSRRSSGDYRSDQRDESGPQRDSGKFSLKEAYKSEQKESNDQNLPWEEKRKHDDTEIRKGKDWKTRKAGEQCAIEDKESSGKKLKLFDPDKDDNYRKDDESKTSSSNLSHKSKEDLWAVKSSGFDGDNDLDAAKIAAMRAAELVNRNLVGPGCLTTDQKKKLLWGGKKSTPTEEFLWQLFFNKNLATVSFLKCFSAIAFCSQLKFLLPSFSAVFFNDSSVLHWCLAIDGIPGCFLIVRGKRNSTNSWLYSCLWQIVGYERRSKGGAEFQQPKQ
ncbi:pre-mRNA-splicing factor 38B isoform X5 [Glycine max]|nr:pre-mRNA-splicing factor 38B isoform X5 [Glycine max]XP_040862081.1 pre-mRNA-splicing factor 38B isoform X5 [Glycine max]